MNDDEFLNDRDCNPTPKGVTPRTDAATRVQYGLTGKSEVVDADFARELERELARALRVVEAARRYTVDDSHDVERLLNAMMDAVEEWEAGR